MKDAISVLFRVDADEQLGLGHLSRCRSLMLVLADTAPCKFAVVTNNQDIARTFLPKLDFDLHAVTDITRVRHADVAIIDIPDIAHRKEESFRGIADLIVGIDDDGPGLQYQDILLRPNLLNLPLPAGMPSDDYWSGRDHIILHPDFKKQAEQPRNVNKRDKKLLVCFGGSDPGDLTLRAISLLKQLRQAMTVQIILGAAFARKQEVIEKTRGDSRFVVNHNISDMAKRIWQADVALISGGTLLYEACALGTPAVVVAQNEPQAVEAKICAAAGAVINLGYGRTATDENIFGALQNLLNNDSIRQRMSLKGPKVVSPEGARLIVSKLLLRVRKRVAA